MLTPLPSAAVDWQTISALATAAGTLVLAVATFVAVRSANRSARIAEQALLTGLRPLLVQSLADDPTHKALWSDRHTARVAGGRRISRFVVLPAAGDDGWYVQAARHWTVDGPDPRGQT